VAITWALNLSPALTAEAEFSFLTDQWIGCNSCAEASTSEKANTAVTTTVGKNPNLRLLILLIPYY